MLSPSLADNGGPTKTHALVPGSPAFDLIPPGSCTVTADQRGEPRPQGAGCDAGAYEAHAYALTTGTAGAGTGTVSAGGTYQEGATVSVTATPSGGSAFAGWTVDGSPAGTANPLAVTMGAAHTVVATFTAPVASPSPSPSPAPSPAPPPPGSPTLTVPPPPPDQGSVAVARDGNRATLTATPAQGQLFLGWNVAVAGASGQAVPGP